MLIKIFAIGGGRMSSYILLVFFLWYFDIKKIKFIHKIYIYQQVTTILQIKCVTLPIKYLTKVL